MRILRLSATLALLYAAGLAAADGDAVVVMDSDLQDDPQAIPRFLAKWEAGFEVVYAIRLKRKENAIKRLMFRTLTMVVLFTTTLLT